MLRRRGLGWIVVVLTMGAVLVPVAAGAQPPSDAGLSVEVVSSAADQVSGGDARLHISARDDIRLSTVEVLVNGADQTDRFSQVAGRRLLSGVVDSLVLGSNEIEVTARDRFGVTASRSLTVVNHPAEGPVFSGPHQYPFICQTERAGLGQPLVDSADRGYAVFAEDETGAKTDEVVGFSQDCAAETLVVYRYRTTAGAWADYTPGQERPEDMATTTTIEGQTVDYIVRWERGTINRFVYSVAMLAPNDTSPDDRDSSAWSGRLVYYFQGGVAIGHDQGTTSTRRMLYDDALSLGYAVIYSTGTKTGTHYNLQVGGETALMVKEHFIELYDVPLYTVGVGGSGGAIQQYVYGQNHRGLIDAAVPQYSYPDMVTQTIHVGDCELLEFYMDVVDAGNPKWATWSNRRWLEGMNASDTWPNPYTGGLPGSTECVNGWRGLSPLALNPLYGAVDGMELWHPIDEVLAIEWTHWADLVNIYGRDATGFARNPWDNVGVQYGLQALVDGNITPGEFLELNAAVGGWKDEADMVQEGSPFFPPGEIDLTNWDPWSARNQLHDVPISPRTEGDPVAGAAAYESGMVFVGDIDIPIIDWRHYLEDALDMHNSHQSFAARSRMESHDGDAANQVVWFTDTRGLVDDDDFFDQTPMAFAVIDEWMANMRANPRRGVAGNKPAAAVDSCFDIDGDLVASGSGVWDGILDSGPQGTCAATFPTYSTSRVVAGGPLAGGVFKCALQPVSDAIAAGVYGDWVPSAEEQATLQAIFPTGVCDYTQGDVFRP